MGTELIGVTVGECQNPRKNVPKAIKRTFWRILIFYIGSCVPLFPSSFSFLLPPRSSLFARPPYRSASSGELR